MYCKDEVIVVDYIFSYQNDEEVAKKNLSNNLNKMFRGMNLNDRMFISKTIQSIVRKYPNYNYKGYNCIEYKKNNK